MEQPSRALAHEFLDIIHFKVCEALCPRNALHGAAQKHGLTTLLPSSNANLSVASSLVKALDEGEVVHELPELLGCHRQGLIKKQKLPLTDTCWLEGGGLATPIPNSLRCLSLLHMHDISCKEVR